MVIAVIAGILAFIACENLTGDNSEDDNPIVTGVTVDPVTAVVEKGGTLAFTAVVTGTGNPAQTVIWTLSGGIAGTSIHSTTGQLSVDIGETAIRLTVTAISTADSSKTGMAAITVILPKTGMLPAATSTITITGNAAYYYNPDFDYYKGVFIDGRTITLSPFHIAKYETTYELWYTVYQWAKDHGYAIANKGREGHDGTEGTAPTEAAKYEPVTTINWRDAIVWCNAYSEMWGRDPVYYTDNTYGTVLRTSTKDTGTNTAADKAVMKEGVNGWRLPTEAEWEYAARGGGTPSVTGSFADKWAGTNEESALGNYAWYRPNSYDLGSGHAGYGTNLVGGKTANALGLHDMSGNVWEWCWDWYGAVDGSTPAIGPASGTDRVGRGGGWDSNVGGCAVAYRYRIGGPENGRGVHGFRAVYAP
jgi:formylglycine-generating enzyme required for sulfatase activity